MSSVVGMKMLCLDRRSTTTRMVVKSLDWGSCSMKSMKIKFQGLLGTGSCFRSPKGLCLGTLDCLHVVQDLQ